MQKWEYTFIEYVKEQKGFNLKNGVYYWGDDKSLSLSIKERLNKFGKDGWEIVGSCGTNSYICWTFKRPIKNAIKSPTKDK